MTENEAIAKFKRTSVLWESATNTEMVEAVKVAIQALEEIQEYRALGISMTPQMIKDLIKSEKKAHKIALENASMLDEYQAIGTIEDFKALKKKSVAKQPDYEGDGCWDGHVVIDTWICPNCEKHYEVDYDDYDYCPNCGQHIDHSGLTEDD